MPKIKSIKKSVIIQHVSVTILLKILINTKEILFSQKMDIEQIHKYVKQFGHIFDYLRKLCNVFNAKFLLCFEQIEYIFKNIFRRLECNDKSVSLLSLLILRAYV